MQSIVLKVKPLGVEIENPSEEIVSEILKLIRP